jgi:cytochrome c
MNHLISALCVLALTSPAFADGTGDAAAGEKEFKKCKACHSVIADDETVIFKGGKTGPNLYGINGRVAGTVDGFNYGDDIVKAGEQGLVWNEANFAQYVLDPKAFLQDYLKDTSAKSKMAFRLKSGGEDIHAYLVSVGPE